MQGTLARKLRVLRAERGLTLRDAERVTGVDKDTLSKIERGTRRPYDVTLSRIAKGYEVSVEELLEEPVGAGKDEASEAGHSEEDQPRLVDEEPQLDENGLAAICGDLSNEIKRVRETPAEYVKTQRLAELRELESEASTALTRAINGQSWGLDPLSRQALLRLRRRKAQQGPEGVASEAG